MNKAYIVALVVAGLVAIGVAVTGPRSLGGGAYSLSMLGYEVALHFDVSRQSAETQRNHHASAGWPACAATVDTIYILSERGKGSP